ncbi:MAG: cobalamin-dependent protein, partial [Candidatus Omnitrophica bacterium]|nr:cobalamin-dependent protein [Candidatus Omnitrophota bacterium]
MNIFQVLLRASRLAVSLWVPAGLLYFSTHVSLSGTFGVPLFAGRFLDPALSLFLQGGVLIWAWGLAVENLSGEALTARVDSFYMSLKQGWWVALLAFVLPISMHYLLFVIAGRDAVPLAAVQAGMSVFTAYGAAWWFVHARYGRFVSGGIRDVPLSGGFLFLATLLWLVTMSVYVAGIWAAGFSFFKPLTGFAGSFVQIGVFTVFAAAFLNTYPLIGRAFESKKTLILVSPRSTGLFMGIFETVLLRSYPAFFAVIRALTPPGYRVVEYNRVFWEGRFVRGQALVAISCFTVNAADAYGIAREFKCKGATVVMGGPHVTFFPDEALEFCDSVVLGPAESVWEDVVRG